MLEKIFVQALSFLTFFIVVSQISLKDFGLFNLLLTLVSIATTVVSLGIDRLIVADVSVYRARGEFGTIRKLFNEYALLNGTLLVVLFVCSGFLENIAQHFYTINFSLFYWILVGFIVGQSAMNYASVVLESLERFQSSFIVKLCESIVRTGVILCLFYWFGFSLVSVLWAYVIAKAFASAISIPLIFSAVMSLDSAQLKNKDNILLLSILRGHGKWESALTMLQTLTSNLIPWIVNILVSTEGVALLAFVQKINSVVTRAVPVRSAIFPIISHSVAKSRTLAAVIITKARKYLLVLYTGVYLGTCIFSGFFIATFVPQYAAATGLIFVSMLRLFIDAYSIGQSPVFYALKLQKVTFVVSVFTIMSTLLLNTLCTYLWDVTGLILSVLGITLVTVLVREYILYTRYNFPLMRWKELFVFDKYDRLILGKVGERFGVSFFKKDH